MNAELDLIKQGVAHYKEEYERELDSSDRWIRWCEEQEDTHGKNFHQGRRSALVFHNIMLTHFLDACSKLAERAALDAAQKGQNK